MTTLLEIREFISDKLGRYETPIRMAGKFLLTLFCMIGIDARLNYSDTASSPFLVIIIALIGALAPIGVTTFLLALVILLQLFALSLEAAAAGAILFLLVLLLYYRFSPRYSVIILLMPLAYLVGMPYLVSLLAGLLCTPAASVAVALGVIVAEFIRFVSSNQTAIGSSGGSLTDSSESVSAFRYIIDGLAKNQALVIMVIATVCAVLIVYFIRRLSINYSWMVALAAGGVAQLLIVLIGDMVFNTTSSVGTAFLGAIVSIALAFLFGLIFYNLDYSRIENTQFEDDEYYYYVKAVPKVYMRKSSRSVKQINTSRHANERGGGRSGRGYNAEAVNGYAGGAYAQNAEADYNSASVQSADYGSGSDYSQNPEYGQNSDAGYDQNSGSDLNAGYAQDPGNGPDAGYDQNPGNLQNPEYDQNSGYDNSYGGYYEQQPGDNNNQYNS